MTSNDRYWVLQPLDEKEVWEFSTQELSNYWGNWAKRNTDKTENVACKHLHLIVIIVSVSVCEDPQNTVLPCTYVAMSCVFVHYFCPQVPQHSTSVEATIRCVTQATSPSEVLKYTFLVSVWNLIYNVLVLLFLWFFVSHIWRTVTLSSCPSL